METLVAGRPARKGLYLKKNGEASTADSSGVWRIPLRLFDLVAVMM